MAVREHGQGIKGNNVLVPTTSSRSEVTPTAAIKFWRTRQSSKQQTLYSRTCDIHFALLGRRWSLAKRLSPWYPHQRQTTTEDELFDVQGHSTLVKIQRLAVCTPLLQHHSQGQREFYGFDQTSLPSTAISKCCVKIAKMVIAKCDIWAQNALSAFLLYKWLLIIFGISRWSCISTPSLTAICSFNNVGPYVPKHSNSRILFRKPRQKAVLQ